MDIIRITNGQGFQLTIGQYTISVQIDHTNHCTRGDNRRYAPETETVVESPDCEIAIWIGNLEDWVTKRVVQEVLGETICTDIMGWVTPFQVGQIIAWMTAQDKESM